MTRGAAAGTSMNSGLSRTYLNKCAQRFKIGAAGTPRSIRANGVSTRIGENSEAELAPLSASRERRDTIFDAGIEYGMMGGIMNIARKITVEVPLELLEKAQRASGTGVTQTVRTGLQLVAASRTYARLRKLRGKVRFSRSVTELKADR